MAFEIRQGRYVSRFFFQGFEGGNILAFVYRDAPSEPWYLHIRVKHYITPEVIWPSQDRSSAFRIEISEIDIEAVLTKVRRILEKASTLFPPNAALDEVIVDSDDADLIINKLNAQSWAHGKIMKPDGTPATPIGDA